MALITYDTKQSGDHFTAEDANEIKSVVNENAPKYTVYTAILTQSGTSNPVASAQQNDIGAIVWTRDSQGISYGTLTGAFPAGRTLVFVNANVNVGATFVYAGPDSGSEDQIRMLTLGSLSPDVLADNWTVYIEIRIYPA